ncbi:hypothetical protein Syun_000029 [Stephania yunnanensis]|uniref:Uncharacterized protein n=1 Tax=Stephania yunnanensis TaxID=152371 RepID=A0AAP0Q6F4_9MAGN
MALRCDLYCAVCRPQKPSRIFMSLLGGGGGSRTHLPIHQYVRCAKISKIIRVIRAAGPPDSSSDQGRRRRRRKCDDESKEREVVEALESLEEEAISGEDEGREPTDYNRRAHIFDACSKVFQDLNHHHHDSSTTDHGQTK